MAIRFRGWRATGFGALDGAAASIDIPADTAGILAPATDSNTLVTGGPAPSFAPDAVSPVAIPLAISGTAIEVYSGRVWIANGPTITFSVPGSLIDFSSANGGGNFTSSDSFLRVAYIQLKQTNGFLYLIGDSSVNYISGVQTSGSPPVTTLTNQNADPEVGSPWPATVDVFSRNILFANPRAEKFTHLKYLAPAAFIDDYISTVAIARSMPNVTASLMLRPHNADAVKYFPKLHVASTVQGFLDHAGVRL